LQIFSIEEIAPRSKDIKFTFKIAPFEAKNYLIGIEYLPKFDMIKVVASVGITKNLKENFKLKKVAEQYEINALFSKPLRARKFIPTLQKDFSSLEGFKFLIQQNLSAQMLLDTITEGFFVLQELAELLVKADQSLKVPKVSETSKSMFQ